MKRIWEIVSQVFTVGFKRTYFIISMIAFILGEVGRNLYRPYVYQNNIDDFGFADSIGNSLGTIAIVFLVLSLAMREGFRKEPYFIVFLVGWILLYESAQGLIPGYYFDWKDVEATVVAGALSYLIYMLVKRSEETIGKRSDTDKSKQTDRSAPDR